MSSKWNYKCNVNKVLYQNVCVKAHSENLRLLKAFVEPYTSARGDPIDLMASGNLLQMRTPMNAKLLSIWLFMGMSARTKLLFRVQQVRVSHCSSGPETMDVYWTQIYACTYLMMWWSFSALRYHIKEPRVPSPAIDLIPFIQIRQL